MQEHNRQPVRRTQRRCGGSAGTSGLDDTNDRRFD